MKKNRTSIRAIKPIDSDFAPSRGEPGNDWTMNFWYKTGPRKRESATDLTLNFNPGPGFFELKAKTKRWREAMAKAEQNLEEFSKITNRANRRPERMENMSKYEEATLIKKRIEHAKEGFRFLATTPNENSQSGISIQLDWADAIDEEDGRYNAHSARVYLCGPNEKLDPEIEQLLIELVDLSSKRAKEAARKEAREIIGSLEGDA